MLSHYRLVEKIGEGAMGVVWKAEDTVLGRTVAIKVLPADLALDEERRRMFLDEARLAASVSHGNIVQVHELGREGDLDFIVMEYVEGQPLNRLLHGRPLPPEKVADWGLQVAQGLARAHRKGLIHRDLKPANILVTPEGEAKIVDFGLATLFAPLDSTTGSWTLTLTEAPGSETSTRIAGTLPYMSPEQLRGEKLDARSDIFSFGTVLYEMTTGQRPFTGLTPAEVAKEILRSQPKPVHEQVPKVPLELRWIIEKLLARRPADRFQIMDDLAVDLKRLAKNLESGSAPSSGDVQVAPRADRARKRRDVQKQIHSIAVLPLENLSRAPRHEYFADGMTEALLTRLAQIASLRVISRTAVMAYKGIRKPLPRIAEELGVDGLIEGTALLVGERVRVTVQLIRAGSDALLWAEQYERNLGDVLSLQNEVARKIATEIQARLTSSERARLRRSRRVDPEAYRLFLEGRHLLAR